MTERQIEDWLRQFQRTHQDLAARILDAVEFHSQPQIMQAFRSVLQTLPGWDIDESKRKGRWRFVSFSSSAGTSGDGMLYLFRQATGLGHKTYNNLFIHKSELLKDSLSSDDTVVFVDDYAGSGDQACTESGKDLQELLPGEPNTYLILVACDRRTGKRIQDDLGLTVRPYIQMDESDDIFHGSCKHFSKAEQDLILQYCKRSDAKKPKGYGDCGHVVVFAHNCPNNTIPILRVLNSRWSGLFRRFS